MENTILIFNCIKMEMGNKLDKLARSTITLPFSLLIKIDIERKKTNLTRSAWITKVIEASLNNAQDKQIYIEEVRQDVKDIKRIIESTLNK